MKIKRTIRIALISFLFNLVYAIFNTVTGIVFKEWWFITVGAYYLVLNAMRFYILNKYRRGGINADFGTRGIGFMFILLSVCLVGTVILATVDNRGIVFNRIIMIAISVYSFTKVVLAIVNLVRAGRLRSGIIKILRNVSLADAFVSIFALQRSMLVSFGEMQEGHIRIFNLLTGTAVCILVLILGINLIGGRCVNMAKSKLVNANKKIEKAVVGGYKKVEGGVVKAYTKIEDKFVDAFLTREGETVEEAKARLKNENNQN